jgi:hypothetical protein
MLCCAASGKAAGVQCSYCFRTMSALRQKRTFWRRHKRIFIQAGGAVYLAELASRGNASVRREIQA